MSRDALTILQVSPSDVGGGAEKVATELHHAYIAAEQDSWLAVGTRHGDDRRIVKIPNTESSSAWERRLIGAAESLQAPADSHGVVWALDRTLRVAASPAHFLRVQRGYEDFDFPGTAHLLELTPAPPDVLHLHNLHGGYFDIRMLPRLSGQLPTILTMHDVWPLTGHCAYPLECTRWENGCGDCPDLALPQPIRRDASAENAAIKRAAFGAGNLRVATPSRWLMDLVTRSGLAEHLAECRVIPNGVDTNVFTPGDRDHSRAVLELPADAFVILFTARAATSSPFKGFSTLSAALPSIVQGAAGRDVLLVALGDDMRVDSSALRGDPIEHSMQFVPFTDDPLTVAHYYRAADLYLHPAHAENFPLAVLEAMACGTAVVASNAGGIPDIIEDGVSGLLFENGDAGALATAALALMGDDVRRQQVSDAGRIRVQGEYTLGSQVRRYLEWYDQLIGR